MHRIGWMVLGGAGFFSGLLTLKTLEVYGVLAGISIVFLLCGVFGLAVAVEALWKRCRHPHEPGSSAARD